MKKSLLVFIFTIQFLLHANLYAEPLKLDLSFTEIQNLTYSHGLEELLKMIWANHYSKCFSVGCPGIPSHITRILRYTESPSPVYTVLDYAELEKNPLLIQSLKYHFFSNLIIILKEFQNNLNPLNWSLDIHAGNIVYEMISILSSYTDEILKTTSKNSIGIMEILWKNGNIVELATNP